jgi:transposase
VRIPVQVELPKKYSAQALGRSRGGFSTKIHALVDALGNPLRLILTPRQAHDGAQVLNLLEGFTFERIIADRGYAAQSIVDWIVAQGMATVIPPHQSASQPPPYDLWVYRERHLIETFFNKLKHFRRIFARFDKLDSRFLAFLHFASALLWLR